MAGHSFVMFGWSLTDDVSVFGSQVFVHASIASWGVHVCTCVDSNKTYINNDLSEAVNGHKKVVSQQPQPPIIGSAKQTNLKLYIEEY